jgi:hypothetical protein
MRMFLKASVLALLMSSVAYGQSLADIARDNRHKQEAKAASAAAKPKVITNDDLSENAETPPMSPQSEQRMKMDAPILPSSSQSAAHQGAEHQSAEHQSAEQWKRLILAQRSAIAAQQAQVDKLNASIHFVPANLYSNGFQYDQHQVKKQDAAARMQEQLEEQKKNLVQLQEAARRDGMGSAVYDP